MLFGNADIGRQFLTSKISTVWTPGGDIILLDSSGLATNLQSHKPCPGAGMESKLEANVVEQMNESFDPLSTENFLPPKKCDGEVCPETAASRSDRSEPIQKSEYTGRNPPTYFVCQAIHTASTFSCRRFLFQNLGVESRILECPSTLGLPRMRSTPYGPYPTGRRTARSIC